MGLSAHCNGINNDRLTAPIDIDAVPSPNEAAEDGATIIVTVRILTNDVLRGAGGCILQIPVNVTGVSWNSRAACERW
jgi:hypothetical protein